MNEEKTGNDLSGWFSTYGVITAQRLLERYHIKLKDDDLIYALKTPNTFYNRLLRIPLKNVFNGIILQQVRDYQIYAQKLFVDYLLSGEDSKVETAPGANTREIIESKRQELIALGNDFHQQELEQEKLIIKSQTTLNKYAENWQKKIISLTIELKSALDNSGISIAEENIKKALVVLLTQFDFNQNLASVSAERWNRVEEILQVKMSSEIRQIWEGVLEGLTDFADQSEEETASYNEKITEMNARLREYRRQFTTLIIRVTELSKLLPEYQFDVMQTSENQESLYFNAQLGEEETR